MERGPPAPPHQESDQDGLDRTADEDRGAPAAEDPPASTAGGEGQAQTATPASGGGLRHVWDDLYGRLLDAGRRLELRVLGDDWDWKREGAIHPQQTGLWSAIPWLQHRALSISTASVSSHSDDHLSDDECKARCDEEKGATLCAEPKGHVKGDEDDDEQEPPMRPTCCESCCCCACRLCCSAATRHRHFGRCVARPPPLPNPWPALAHQSAVLTAAVSSPLEMPVTPAGSRRP